MQQKAFDGLRQVEDELLAVQAALDLRLESNDCAGSDRALLAEARAQTERTYLLRILAEFEGHLARIGPILADPIHFTDAHGLAYKLDTIGKNKNIDSELRQDVDDRIREHRNELMHGRSPVPRVSFVTTHDLMKAFLRNCW